MGWPEDALIEGEHIVTKFRQHWKLLIIPVLWFVAAVVAIWLVARWFPDGWVAAISVAGVVIAALVLVVRPVVDWFVTYYVLTSQRLITRTGLIARSGIEIPLENITNVNFSQSIIERLLQAGDLVIESAGQQGTSEFHNIPQPDEFQALLYRTRDALGDAKRAPPPVQVAAPDATEQLRKLKELHDDGLITDEEFLEKRSRLLEQM